LDRAAKGCSHWYRFWKRSCSRGARC
jgi:hypothetical protein